MNNITVTIDLPTDILLAADISVTNASDDIKKYLALFMLKERRLSFGKACELAEMDKLDFMEYAGSKNISLNYDIQDYEEDLETIRGLSL